MCYSKARQDFEDKIQDRQEKKLGRRIWQSPLRFLSLTSAPTQCWEQGSWAWRTAFSASQIQHRRRSFWRQLHQLGNYLSSRHLGPSWCLARRGQEYLDLDSVLHLPPCWRRIPSLHWPTDKAMNITNESKYFGLGKQEAFQLSCFELYQCTGFQDLSRLIPINSYSENTSLRLEGHHAGPADLTCFDYLEITLRVFWKPTRLYVRSADIITL